MAYHWEFGVNVDWARTRKKQDIYEKIENAVAKLPGQEKASSDTVCYLKAERGERDFTVWREDFCSWRSS